MPTFVQVRAREQLAGPDERVGGALDGDAGARGQDERAPPEVLVLEVASQQRLALLRAIRRGEA
jgi:hypothetical protein